MMMEPDGNKGGCAVGRPESVGLPAAVRACLFDLDGVLTRTAVVHDAAWKDTFDAYLRGRDGDGFRPFDPDRDYAEYVDGKVRTDGVRSFLASRGITLPEGAPDDPPTAETVHGLGNRKNEVLLQRIRDDGVEVYEGSVRYVRAVRAAGLRTAVVSSSANTADVLEVTGLAPLFDARVDGLVIREQGLRGKPAPDSFLAGAAALGAGPPEAAVFEDAVSGVEAGRAGGFAYVVGVDRVGHAEALRAHGADIVVTDLAELLP
jgi:beta-phosphoglucomutase family hydrolase